MDFSHHPDIWRDFPDLVPGVAHVTGITADTATDKLVAAHTATALSRLDTAGSEAQLPEIQAWRRAFSTMGLKPTQYRCASESLLRRLRKEGSLPQLHPLVDLCNAISVAYAVPVAAIDLSRVDGDLTVRYAAGGEDYETFGGEHEHPDQGEVVFADTAGNAHARRWTNRQSGRSAVHTATSEVLIVAEALHPTAAADITALLATLAADLAEVWGATATTSVLTPAAAHFTTG